MVDRFGVGVPNVPVRFAVTRGGGRISQADSATDAYGIAGATATFGPGVGAQQFTATAGGMTVTFDAHRAGETDGQFRRGGERGQFHGRRAWLRAR